MSRDQAKRDAGMFLSNTQMHVLNQPGVGDVFFSHSVLHHPLIPDHPPFFCFQIQNISNAPHRALRLQSQGISQPNALSSASSTLQTPLSPTLFYCN